MLHLVSAWRQQLVLPRWLPAEGVSAARRGFEFGVDDVVVVEDLRSRRQAAEVGEDAGAAVGGVDVAQEDGGPDFAGGRRTGVPAGGAPGTVGGTSSEPFARSCSLIRGDCRPMAGTDIDTGAGADRAEEGTVAVRPAAAVVFLDDAGDGVESSGLDWAVLLPACRLRRGSTTGLGFRTR